VIALWKNPELIRNCRAQLRPRRLVLVGSIVAVLSVVIGYSMSQAQAATMIWGDQFLTVALYAQVMTLFIGGGLACGRSISQEREQNTFDFQRVTQLTSLELALGKLFGAPAISYFATFCIFPAALMGAAYAHVPFGNLLCGYVMLFGGAIAFHCFALLLSMNTTRSIGGITGASSAVMLLLVFLMTSVPDATRLSLDLGALGPLAAIDFARHGTWQVIASPDHGLGLRSGTAWTDVFFGVPLHHFPVLMVLYATAAAWCLLALARNLKRDQSLSELFSPVQSVGLLCYLNFIIVGSYMIGGGESFFEGAYRSVRTLSSAFQFFLIVNLGLLYMLGLVLLRNREQARRRAHQRAGNGFDWQEAAWPALYILAGAGCAAALALVRLARPGGVTNDLDAGFCVFTCVILLATMLRDLCFLQWMNLRRAKNPLTLGVILLGVFYTCGSILLVMARFSKPVQTVFMAIIAPWGLAGADAAERSQWSHAPGPWMIGLGVQVALVVYFAALHYKLADELRPARAAIPARAPATGD